MRTPVYTRQFERDLKRLRKRGKNLAKLRDVVRTLVEEKPLDPLQRDHCLIGNWRGRRECHIESDWLLVYKLQEDLVVFERTGSHSDLFRE